MLVSVSSCSSPTRAAEFQYLCVEWLRLRYRLLPHASEVAHDLSVWDPSRRARDVRCRRLWPERLGLSICPVGTDSQDRHDAQRVCVLITQHTAISVQGAPHLRLCLRIETKVLVFRWSA